MNKLIKLSLLAASILATHEANAEIEFSGFASIKGGKLFDKPKDLNNNGELDPGEIPFDSDLTHDLNFKRLSLFALQANAELGDGLDATVQLVADGAKDFEVEARWAYLSYQLNNNLSVQAGRIVLPSFYKSEFDKVGFAHAQNILPKTVYTHLNFTSVEGVRFIHKGNLGDWSSTATFGLASWDGGIYIAATGEDYDAELTDIMSSTFEATNEIVTFFAGGYLADVQFDSLDQAITFPIIDSALEPALNAGLVTQSSVDQLKDAMSYSGDGQYYYYGFDVDYNDWLVTYEFAKYGVKDSGDSLNESWYLTAGKRFDRLTATVTTGKLEQPINYNHITALDPSVQGLGLAIKKTLSAQYYSIKQVSFAYNFHSSAAMKFELYQWDPLESGEQIRGASVGIDLVF